MGQTFLKALEEFGCKDQSATMSRFLDDEEFYYSILLQMLDEPGFEQLGEDLKGTDVHKAFDTAHMLKGITANCGITPMSDLILAIVEPLRAGNMDGLLPTYEKLIAKRDELKTILQSVSPA